LEPRHDPFCARLRRWHLRTQGSELRFPHGQGTGDQDAAQSL